MDSQWTRELDDWLEPFLAALGRVERRRWAPVYLHGLLSPATRKNVEQMAGGSG
ncbi:MAG TPA: transposase [Chloroflexota bacterium]|nr:transposase [Chloroflexota bacterium]